MPDRQTARQRMTKATCKNAPGKAVATDQPSSSPYPPVGRVAPAFRLPASTGKTVSLRQFRGDKIVVLYFYPRDNTPGCTREACGFRDASAEFEKLGAAVLGISPDSVESHRRFAEKHGLPFPLLSDADHAVAEKYGVWQDKKMAGQTYKGIVRTTFVIDRKGRIAHVFEKVKPDGHDQQVLAWIRENLTR